MEKTENEQTDLETGKYALPASGNYGERGR